MVKVEETTQGVLDKISEGFAQKGAFRMVFPSVTVTANISK